MTKSADAADRAATRRRKASTKEQKKRRTRKGVAFPRPFTIRESPVQGMGGFALRWIDEGERIVEYRGERITPDEADERYDDEEGPRHHTFLFSVDDSTVIDAAVNGNEARFINHSCEPNCEAVDRKRRIFIEAIRPIAPGEELFYDYNFELDEPLTPELKRRYPCHCGAPSCRKTILVEKEKKEKKKKKKKKNEKGKKKKRKSGKGVETTRDRKRRRTADRKKRKTSGKAGKKGRKRKNEVRKKKVKSGKKGGKRRQV